jgi:hypothetical protein
MRPQATSATTASTATGAARAPAGSAATPLTTVTKDAGQVGPAPRSKPIAVKPDPHTLYLGSGSLPEPMEAELNVPFPLRLTAHVRCSGHGELRVVAGNGAARVAAFGCPNGGDDAALGRVDRGSVSFRMVGDPGIAYVLRVQANRRLP